GYATPALPLLRIIVLIHDAWTRAARFPAVRVRGDRLLWLGNVGIARHLDVELERGVLLHEFHRREGEMLRVVGLARDRGERGRHLRVVEQRRLVLFDRVDQIELAALS